MLLKRYKYFCIIKITIDFCLDRNIIIFINLFILIIIV